MPVQTIMTADGKTVTASGTVGFAINDIQRLYETLHHAEDTISNLAMAALANHVRELRLEECKPASLEQSVIGDIDLEQYGLCDVRVSILEFAVVRTFRLIQGQKWSVGTAMETERDIAQGQRP